MQIIHLQRMDQRTTEEGVLSRRYGWCRARPLPQDAADIGVGRGDRIDQCIEDEIRAGPKILVYNFLALYQFNQLPG
jgi:hypothetical protein